MFHTHHSNSKKAGFLISFAFLLFTSFIAISLLANVTANAACNGPDGSFLPINDGSVPNGATWASIRVNQAQRFGFAVKNSSSSSYTWTSSGTPTATQMTVRLYDYKKVLGTTVKYWDDNSIQPFGGWGMTGNTASKTTSCGDGRGTVYDSMQPGANIAPGSSTNFSRYFEWQPPSTTPLGFHGLMAAFRTYRGNSTASTTGENPSWSIYYSNDKYNLSLNTIVVPEGGAAAGANIVSGCKELSESNTQRDCGTYWQPGKVLHGLVKPTISITYPNTAGGNSTVTSAAYPSGTTVIMPTGAQTITISVNGIPVANATNNGYVQNIRYYFKYDDGSGLLEDPYNKDDTQWSSSHPLGNTSLGSNQWTRSITGSAAGKVVNFCGQGKDTPGNISLWNCFVVTFKTPVVVIEPDGDVKPKNCVNGFDNGTNDCSLGYSGSYSPDHVIVPPTANTPAYFRHRIDVSGYTADYSGTYNIKYAVFSPSQNVTTYYPSSSEASLSTYVNDTTFNVTANGSILLARRAYNIAAGTANGTKICEYLTLKDVPSTVTINTPNPARACVRIVAPSPIVIPDSDVDVASVYVGDTATFTHYIESQLVGSSYFSADYRVREITASSPTTPSTYKTLAATFNVTSSNKNTVQPVNTNSFTALATQLNQYVCQDLVLSNITSPGTYGGPNPSSQASTRVCVHVIARPVVPAITPTSSATPYFEPGATPGETVTFNHSATATGTFTGSYSITRSKKNPAAAILPISSGTFNVVSGTVTFSPAVNNRVYTPLSTAEIGSQFCEIISLTGMTGGVANISSIEACSTTVARPYTKFYGLDVNVACGSGGVFMYAKNSGGFIGSSSQYALIAAAAVDGTLGTKKGMFSNSANVGSSNPKQLTFANTGANYGGTFDQSGACNDSYFSAAGESSRVTTWTASTSVTPISNTVHGNQAPNVTINSNNNYTGQGTLYIDGNAYINDPVNNGGNITYNTGSWGLGSAMPSFRLIVNGNIYIDNDVTRLDGFYFATGNIYTCTTSASAASFPGYASCGQQLKVYGALQANGSVKLWRTSNVSNIDYGTLNKAGNMTENTAITCTLSTSTCSNVAELFIFSPEMYFSKWSAPTTSTSSGGAYSDIRSLPPIF